MIHEAMVLEYAGPDLALVELAAHMRLVIFLGLLANLFVPWGIATTTHPLELLAAAAIAVTAKIAVLGVAVAVFEVFVAKLRLFRVPELLAASFVLAFLAVTASFFAGMNDTVFVQLLDLAAGARAGLRLRRALATRPGRHRAGPRGAGRRPRRRRAAARPPPTRPRTDRRRRARARPQSRRRAERAPAHRAGATRPARSNRS